MQVGGSWVLDLSDRRVCIKEGSLQGLCFILSIRLYFISKLDIYGYCSTTINNIYVSVFPLRDGGKMCLQNSAVFLINSALETQKLSYACTVMFQSFVM
jgi:hypothetical protein